MKKIGKYEIVEEIGRGGMGVVYRAYDTVMDREVAVKVILDIALNAPEIKARFYREARTAGKLTHENITIVHDVGEDEGRPFIVMEYLPGYDLRSILDRKQPLSLLQKLEISVQIARGLAFSHSRDIIHRDVKPANIRIIDDRKVKIMDFGIAKPGSSSMTSTGTLIGTPYYMSPEQIQGQKIDKRSDIFSFGVLLYEFLTYHKPFTGNEPTAVMYKIVHEPPEHFEELERGAPPALKAIVSRLLQKEPAQRHQTLEEVTEELERLVADLKRADSKKFEEQRKKFDKIIADARALLSKKRFQEAYQATEKAAAIDSANSQLMRVREEIKLAEAEENKRAQIAEQLAVARKLYSGKKYSEAIAALNEVLKLDSRQREALDLLKAANEGIASHLLSQAQVYFKKGDSENASRLAERILAQNAEHRGARELLRAIEAQKLCQETQVAGAEGNLTQTVEVERKPPPAVATKPSPPEKKRPVLSKKTMLIAAAIVALIAVVVSYRLFLYTPQPPQGTVALNILPWAEITKIQRQGGAMVPLSEKSVTPCLLALPEGTYEIHLNNPGFETPLVLTVTVRAGETQEVRKKIPGFEYESILSTF